MSENEQEFEEASGKSPFSEQLSRFIWTFLVVASAILFYYLIQYLGNISDFFLKKHHSSPFLKKDGAA